MEKRYIVIAEKPGGKFVHVFKSYNFAAEYARRLAQHWTAEEHKTGRVYVVQVCESDLAIPGDWRSFKACNTAPNYFDSSKRRKK